VPQPQLLTTYLRVGFDPTAPGGLSVCGRTFIRRSNSRWRTILRRRSSSPPGRLAHLPASCANASLRFVQNAEARLFQRPDDAISSGYDKQTESDFTRSDNFFSNYEPLGVKDAVTMFEDSLEFYQYTAPMQNLILAAARNGEFKYYVCSSRPRVVDGRPSKNPRYLQIRPDLINPRETYLAEMSSRLFPAFAPERPCITTSHCRVAGRRNNPPEPGVRPLAVFNPIITSSCRSCSWNSSPA
jgi:hypothetical protein